MTETIRETSYSIESQTESILVSRVNDCNNCTYTIGKFIEDSSGQSLEVLANIKFQVGPVKENGINGCQNEDLIAVVIDRLQQFQQGEFKCRENAIAITKLEEALMWLEKRTADRVARGVEGTSNI